MTEQIDTLKREAKKLSRATSITHMQALDVLAAQRGYGHWGALAAHLERAGGIPAGDAAPSAIAGCSAKDLLEKVLQTPLPHLAGCRHVLISGATSTGKTTLLRQLVAAIPAGTRIASVEDTRELALPADAAVFTTSRTDPANTDGEVIVEALGNRPDILLVGEVSTSGAMAILGAMTRSDGPLVATTIHASSAHNAPVVFAQRVAHLGRGSLPAGVAIVHIERDPDGTRRVAEVIRSG